MRAALRTLGGVPLYRTNHPSFMYRLWELGQSFPALGGYNPWWNAGTEHYTGVASGCRGWGCLPSPFCATFRFTSSIIRWSSSVYTGAPPLICALSVRAVGGHTPAMAAAAILHRLDPVTFLDLGISVFLMSMWGPLAPTVGGGLLLAYLWTPSHWTRKIFVFLLFCAVLSLLAFWPWIRVLLFPARFVVDYVSQPAVSQTGGGTKFLEGGRRLGEHLASGHPLLLFLGPGGALAADPRSVRRWYMPPMLLLALVCGWGLEWRPYAQLERLGMPILFAAIVPAARTRIGA